jgi:hypothetical protein
VKISLKNTVTGDGPLIKAGMFARVGLAIGKTDQGMLVPKDAIVLGGRTPILQVVEFADKTSEAKPGAGGTVRSVPVTLGAAWKSSVTVSGKIKAGDVIVTMGNERLQNGQEVVIKRVEGIGE